MTKEVSQTQHVSGKIIALFSSASAVGKTTLALNLATALKQDNFRTIVLDFDFQFGDVCNYLKIEPPVSIYDYQRQLQSKRENALESFLLDGTRIPDLLPAPFDIAEACHIESDTVTHLLGELKNRYDYILIDLTTGFTDINLRVLEMANRIYFVGLVDFIPTIKNMKNAYETMRGLDTPEEKIHLILNRNKAKTDIALRDVEALLGQRFYHTLPNDFSRSAAAIQKGLPVILTAPQAELTAAILDLAGKLSGRHRGAAKEKTGGMKKWFSGFLQE